MKWVPESYANHILSQDQEILLLNLKKKILVIFGKALIGFLPKANVVKCGRTVAEAEAPILWSSDVQSQLIGKDFDVGKDGRQKEKEMVENKMVAWHHQLNGHEFEQAPRDGEGQGDLVCCSPWVLKESDRTKKLNINKRLTVVLILMY